MQQRLKSSLFIIQNKNYPLLKCGSRKFIYVPTWSGTEKGQMAAEKAMLNHQEALVKNESENQEFNNYSKRKRRKLKKRKIVCQSSQIKRVSSQVKAGIMRQK
jgi:hypothetical protein